MQNPRDGQRVTRGFLRALWITLVSMVVVMFEALIDQKSGAVNANLSMKRQGDSVAERFRILTRVYAAAAKVNIQRTRSSPRNRVLRCCATVFIQPKTSSTRLRFLWLTTWPS